MTSMTSDSKHLTTSAWKDVLQGLAGLRNSGLSALGANVVVCCGAVKVLLHEILVRRFTRIFDFFHSGNIEELKDENGVIVLIIPYVSSQSLGAMSELLYTGQTLIRSDRTMKDLDHLLTKELCSSVVIDTSEQSQVSSTDEVKKPILKSPYEQSFEDKESRTMTHLEQETVRFDYNAEEDVDCSRMSDDFKEYIAEECDKAIIKESSIKKL